MGINDIGYYVSVLNSREVEVYEFLLYGRCGLNSWDELGELLFSAFSGDLDLRGGVLFRERHTFSYYCGILNSLLIKYMSLCDGVEYTFRFLVDRVYNIGLPSGQINSIKFTDEYRDDLINKRAYPYKSSISLDFGRFIISEIDRGIGLMDIELLGCGIKYYDVMVEDIILVSFSYGGKDYNIFHSLIDSWLRYDSLLNRRWPDNDIIGVSKADNYGVVRVDPDFDSLDLF